jgi:hypothetical protein
VEGTLDAVEQRIFRERICETVLRSIMCKHDARGRLFKGRRPPGSLEGGSPPFSGGTACDRECSGETGWGRATQTSGRKGSDVLAIGAIPSPRLCKLDLPHLPVGGVAQEASLASSE